MNGDELIAGYSAYTTAAEVDATADVRPDQMATITPTVTSSAPCIDFTTTVTVGVMC